MSIIIIVLTDCFPCFIGELIVKRSRASQREDPYERLDRQVKEALKIQAELPYIFCNTLSWIEYARYIKSSKSVWYVERLEGKEDQ